MATYIPNVTDVIPEPSLFTPDFSFIDKMLRRRQGLYEQGFAQVNSAYNFVNRPVTNPYSVQVRDTFLKQAQDNLKNLSSLDLSQQQNVNTATSVFQPFIKNRPVLMDMALTAHYDNQENIADSYRLKDGGKEFSEDNINFVRQQRNAFAQDNINNVGSYYSNRRSYSPYYNYYDEVKAAMKEFKPSSVTVPDKNGFYINVVQDKSWYKEELERYLDGVLSDKAKQQMGIEASVRLTGNTQALSQMYMKEANETLPVLQAQMTSLNKKISAEADPVNKQLLQNNLDLIEKKKKELTDNMLAIQGGDLSYIQTNAERLARGLYTSQKTKEFAGAYAHADIDRDIKFDQAALEIFKQQQENWRTKYKEDRADDREKLKNGAIIPITVPAEDVMSPDKTSLNNELKGKKALLLSKHEELKDHIAQILGGDRIGASISEEEFETYIKQNPGDKMVAQYTKLGLSVQRMGDEVDQYEKNADSYAKGIMDAKNPGTYDKAVAYKKAVDETWKEVNRLNSPSSSSAGAQQPLLTPSYNMMNGDLRTQMGIIAQQKQTNTRVVQAAGSMAEKSLGLKPGEGQELLNMYNSLRTKYMNDPKTNHLAVTVPAFQIQSTNPKWKLTADYLKQNTGIDDSKITGITYVTTPRGLDLQFTAGDPKTNKYQVENVLNLLKTRLAEDDIKYNKETGVFTVKGLGSRLVPELDPYVGVDMEDREPLAKLSESSGQPGAHKDQPFIVQDRAGTNRMFRIRKTFGNTTEGNGYYIYGDGTSRPLINQKFDNVRAPYKYMKSLILDTPQNLDILFESKK